MFKTPRGFIFAELMSARRFKSSPVNTIFCQALAGSPLRPQRLIQLDKEQEEQMKPPFSGTTEAREVRQTALSQSSVFEVMVSVD